MRQLIKTLIFVALAVSCTREIVPEPAIDALVRRYNLSFVESTKTELSGSGSTRQVKWNEGDEIKYYTKDKQSSVSTASVSVSGDAAYIEIPCGRNDDFINAVYGAGYLSGGTADCIYVTSPAKNAQSYTSFAQAHLCAAFSADLEDPDLKFHNAVSILKFTSAASISKVVFSGNNGEIITGGSNGSLKLTYSGGAISAEPFPTGGSSVTIFTGYQVSDFYIAILPVQFVNGITIECYNSNMELIGIKKTLKTINTVSASGTVKVLDLGSISDWINTPLPEAIDLGLPSGIKWASFNIGATKPGEYGDYFAWGEIKPKEDYSWLTYSFRVSGTDWDIKFNKYCTLSSYTAKYWGGIGQPDHKVFLDPEDDAAFINVGGSWRMPTDAEWKELISNCEWTWTNYNKYSNGYLITGPNNNSIFLPASGNCNEAGNSRMKGSVGLYWSSSLRRNSCDYAWSVYIANHYIQLRYSDFRYCGFSIRPVFKDK